jgi:hypothetical protein
MRRRLPDTLIFALAGLLTALPTPVAAQRYGGGWHGGGWYGGHRGYYGYRPYYGYPGYYGYGPYPYYNGAWVAVGAGVLGVMIGSAIARPYYYPYPYAPVIYAPPPPPPTVVVQQVPAAPPAPAPAPPAATTQCAAGTVMSAEGYCQALPRPSPERG